MYSLRLTASKSCYVVIIIVVDYFCKIFQLIELEVDGLTEFN